MMLSDWAKLIHNFKDIGVIEASTALVVFGSGSKKHILMNILADHNHLKVVHLYIYTINPHKYY